ncbi:MULTISPECIES: hypothetical protein [Streptomyces]|uniref:Cytochrome b561 n=1 Tax=Streptomyces stelliscabiei TaxID=146820 RepID=A0A8I0P1U4_9ACTN|nr:MULTISPECIES: hypothetical protein [Streptomyces]MBE1594719.1 cytochrome b561 [Streptomyces stelliscabiei]MDX2519000.1 hypothetical protein [Streptomyces stelliscabiei]
MSPCSSRARTLLVPHIAAQAALYAALAAHVALVLKHRLIDRDRLLRRMP